MDMRVANPSADIIPLRTDTCSEERDGDSPTPNIWDQIDRQVMRYWASGAKGASPLALANAAFDWWSHFALLPGRQIQLAQDMAAVPINAMAKLSERADGGEALPPELILSEGLTRYTEGYIEGLEKVIDRYAHDVPGVTRKHADLVSFAARLSIEPLRPENYLFTNREAMKQTLEEKGANLGRGFVRFLQDFGETAGLHAPSNRVAYDAVGETLAATPGKVVFRNRLIELIQYEPTTEKVHAEPILITPAWIMKYYILDLSQQNSLVKFLVEQGYTVFMISWKNPGRDERDLGFDDYRELGILSAIEAVNALIPDQKIHAVGYCLGGTLLSVALAALARDGDDRVASMSLFAAQVDFRDAGELSLFIDEDQLAALEASMEATGYLEGEQMAAAFTALRSRDLVWRRAQRAYLLGEEAPEFDLMIWNADATRMPPRMHSEYLRHFYLNNDLVNGHFCVEGSPIAISDIRAPMFILGTEKDHVAPWRSVFKMHLFADTEITFVLTSGGHNAGVVSEVGHPHRRHRVLMKHDQEPYIPPNQWLDRAELREGSWWPTWAEWLKARSTGQVAARQPKRADMPGNDVSKGTALLLAPGDYVKMV